MTALDSDPGGGQPCGMEPLQSPADTSYTYVDSAAAMSGMLDRMARADRAAIDTEADSLHHYYEKVCLVQMTVGARNFVIDPLAELDLGAFLAVLAGKTLILHGADYDLRMLRESFGFRPRARPIDTMIAAQLLGCEKLGLSSLTEQWFGVALGKAGQKSDWSRRPLTEAQLRYAVNDTRFLEPLAQRLLAELDRRGRRGWFEESCEAAMAATASDRAADPQRRWRVRGVRDMTARQAAFLRELWRWREQEAQQADRPPFKILGNDSLRELALWASAHPRARFDSAPKLPRHFRRRRLESLRRAIRGAAALGPADWPQPLLRRRDRPAKPGKAFGPLREAVARLAEELGIPPSVLAPLAAIEEISRRRPKGTAAIQQAGGLLRWQADLIAPAVRHTLAANP